MDKENPGFHTDRKSWLRRNKNGISFTATMVIGGAFGLTVGGLVTEGAIAAFSKEQDQELIGKIIVWTMVGGGASIALSALVAISPHLIIGIQEKISKQTRK